jgi:hypothetical protein
MKRTHNPKPSASAETIARLADRGEIVSRFFTNAGHMMPPIPQVSIDNLEKRTPNGQKRIS